MQCRGTNLGERISWDQPSGFLKGTAAAGLGTAAAAAGITPGGVPTAAAEPLPPSRPTARSCAGMDLVTQSPTTEGRFGFMFKSQPPHPASDDAARPPGCDHGRAACRRPHQCPQPRRTHNDAFNENPNPASRRGSPSSASLSTTTSPSTPRSSATSSPTPTPPRTSARPATTSTPSTGEAPTWTRSSTTPTTGTSS